MSWWQDHCEITTEHLPLMHVRSMSLGSKLGSTTHSLCSSSLHPEPVYIWASAAPKWKSHRHHSADAQLQARWLMWSQRWSSEVDFNWNAHSYLFPCLFRFAITCIGANVHMPHWTSFCPTSHFPFSALWLGVSVIEFQVYIDCFLSGNQEKT